MTDNFKPNPNGNSKTISVRLAPNGLAGFLQFAGAILLIFGAYRPVNFVLIGVGIVLGILGFILRSGVQMGGKRVAFEDPLAPQDKSLQIFANEIRSANGYSVRKLEDGIQYLEGDRSLMLRNTAPDSAPSADFASLQETIAQKTEGTRRSFQSVTVKVSSRSALRWDSPYENEPIPPDRLMEIMQRVTQAVTFYEFHGGGSGSSSP